MSHLSPQKEKPMKAQLRATIASLTALTFASPSMAQPKPAPVESKCFPACRAGFQCNEAAQCVAAPAPPSACFPECRPGFKCDEKNACVPDGTGAPVSSPSAPTQRTPAAPASADPKVTIESYADAEVLVDGGVIGRVSADKPLVATLPIGKHSIKLRFDTGGSDSKKVYVQDGAQQPVVFLRTSGAEDADRRRGKLAFGVGGGPEFTALLGGVFVGANVIGTLSYGLGAVVDYQTNAGISVLGDTEFEFLWLKFSVEPKFLFHLGDVYTMSAGLRVGFGPSAPIPWSDPDILVEVAARISLLGFQFGEERQHRIESTGQFGFIHQPFILPAGGVDFRYSIMFP